MRGGGVLLVLAVLHLAPPVGVARAAESVDPDSKATAQVLFDDAKRLIASGKHADACPKLEESQRLDPGMGTQFRLAECYEAVGRTASAWANFVEVADEAKAAGLAAREKAARDRASKVEAKLSRMAVQVAAPDTPGLEVRRGTHVLGRALWGTSVPVDPGEYVVLATAPGKKPWRQTTHVMSSGAQVRVDVPALADAPQSPLVVSAGAGTGLGAEGAGKGGGPGGTPIVDVKRGNGQRVAGITLTAVGVVGLGVAGYLALSARSTYRDTGSHCVGNTCDDEGLDIRDRGRKKAGYATIAGLAGLGLATGGLILWLTAPSSAAEPRVASSAPVSFGVSTNGVWLSGRF